MFYTSILESVGVIDFNPRFWLRVDIKNDSSLCWEWRGYLDSKGYGRMNINHTFYGSHRFVFSLMGIDIPPGLVVMHSCDNPPCCNPLHLSFGTHLDNMQDAIKKGRHISCKYPAPVDGRSRSAHSTARYRLKKLFLL